MTIDKKSEKYFRKHRITRGAHILAGCSGGVDSTVLLHVLARRQARNEYKVSCAYFDHGIRNKEETDADLVFLKKTTENLNTPFYYHRLKAGELYKLAKESRRSLEDLARESRYSYLLKLKQELGADFVALGHTLDDHCETLIMNFFTGAGVLGLCGIPEKRGSVIRPLFYCTRQNNLDYLNLHKLAYREDITNLTEDYLRNKVRHSLLPVVRQIFPGYRTALLHLTRKMSLTKNFLNDELRSRLTWQRVSADHKSTGQRGMCGWTSEEKKAYQINAVDFFSNPGIIRLYSLYAVFDAIRKNEKGKGQRRLPYRFLAPLVEAGLSKEQHVLLQGAGVKIIKKGANLFFERDIVDLGKKGYFILVDEQQKNHIIGDKVITYKVLEANNHMDTDNALYVNMDLVTLPLIIRSKRAGDKIQIKSGAKNIKKLYNEWGVPADERWKIPLVTDRNTILAVGGKSFGFRNRLNATLGADNKKVRAGTKFLRVEVT